MLFRGIKEERKKRKTNRCENVSASNMRRKILVQKSYITRATKGFISTCLNEEACTSVVSDNAFEIFFNFVMVLVVNTRKT